jgi:hypothetical protein
VSHVTTAIDSVTRDDSARCEVVALFKNQGGVLEFGDLHAFENTLVG